MDRGLLGQMLLGYPPPLREDGTQKGEGFFGLLPTSDGRHATELSIGVGFGGQENLIPSIVPGMSAAQLGGLLSGMPLTDDIIQRAVENARMRMLFGLPAFAMPGEQRPADVPIPIRRGR